MKKYTDKKIGLAGPFGPVSAIIPCFKCDKTIERALKSILVQTIKPAEVIIINDSSGPATSRYLYQMCDQFNPIIDGWIKILELGQQMGPAGARNLGWANASNRFIAFLDADDAWHPNKIEIQYTWMQANPNAAITGHKTTWLPRGSSPPKVNPPYAAKRSTSLRLMLSNRFHTRSVMLRRNLPFRFKEEKLYSEDYLLWLEILLNGFNGFYFDLPLAYTFKPQYGASGLSGKLWEMEKGEIDTFYQLYRKNLISFFKLTSLIPFSLLKFAKRKFSSALF